MLISKNKRNLGVDLAKVLACFAVVGLHFSGRDASMVNGVIYFLCGFAVPVFFMANGYFLLNKEKLDYAYVFGKIRSVLVIVVIWNLAVGLVGLVIGKQFNPIYDIVGSLLQQGVLWQFWFFGALMMVQLLSPVIWRVMQSFRGGVLLLLVLGAICVSVDIVSLVEVFKGNAALQSLVRQPFRLWTWVFYFTLGGVVGRSGSRGTLADRLSLKVVAMLVGLSALLVILWQFGVGYLEYGNQWAEYYYDDPSMMLYATSLFVFCDTFFRHHQLQERLQSCLVNMSSCTMGVYVLHPLVLRAIHHWYDFSNGLVDMLLVLVVFTLCLAAVFLAKRIPFVRRFFAL